MLLMNFKRERPPLFDEIVKVFDVLGKPVLFAWGDTIYAPSGVATVAPHLQAHEKIHGDRQLARPDGIEGWWREYLASPEFRLREEVLGHLGEYSWLASHSSGRGERRKHLSVVAGRLASPLYRYSITKDEARRLLDDGYSRAQGSVRR